MEVASGNEGGETGTGESGWGSADFHGFERLPSLRGPMRVTRRGFFQAAGGAAGAAALIRGKLAKAEQAGEDLRRWATPEEVPVPSIFQQCPGGCGLMVRTLDGEVAGLSGNPLHPSKRGA